MAMLARMIPGASQYVGVIGALGGVLATGIVGLTTAFLTQRWQDSTRRDERSHDLSEKKSQQRRDAYVRYIAAVNAVELFLGTRPAPVDPNASLGARIRSARREEPSVFDEVIVAEVELRLVADDEVLRALDSFEDEWTQTLEQALAAADPAEELVLGSTSGSEQRLLEAMRGSISEHS